MKDHMQFKDANELAEHLGSLHAERNKTKQKSRRVRLTLTEKEVVFTKTNGRCHICGGMINKGENWEADHVFPHASGGSHSVDNYLPAHSTCNNYRWFYSPEEFQWILKLGIWWKTRIEKKNKPALEMAEGFVRHEHKREVRRKR